jgi:hypothetical protein
MRHDPVIIGDVAVTNAVNESILQRKRLETSLDGRGIEKPERDGSVIRSTI